jgi:hypothetical protein
MMEEIDEQVSWREFFPVPKAKEELNHLNNERIYKKNLPVTPQVKASSAAFGSADRPSNIVESVAILKDFEPAFALLLRDDRSFV